MVHGHRRAFVRAGSGPALLLLHGIGNNCQTWAEVIDRLAESHTVIAPDLLGHGDSDKPRGDYSIAAYANGMRDLLSVLDIEQATVVGHSLGGGIALQFAYQFPERCERLALVGSGGLGPGAVRRAARGHAARRRTGAHRADRRLRAAAAGLPGPGPGRPAWPACSRSATWPRPATPCSRSRTSRRAGRSCAPCAAWPTPAARRSPRSTGSTSPTPSRCWSSGAAATRSCRRCTPRRSARWCPTARVEVFPGAGHWPHLDDPDRFCDVLLDFIATTEPAQHDLDSWRRLLAQDQRGVVPAAQYA